MSSYEGLAASYDALTTDVGYEKRADFLEKLFRRSRIPVHTVLDLACGTGTGSVVTVLTLLGQVSGQGVQVTMAGGVLTVDVERQGDQVTGLYLTGPTNLVAKGEIFDEELVLP